MMLFFIEEMGFNADFHRPGAQLTLLHVIGKFHQVDFSDREKELITKLINKINNLLLRNNFGKTVVKVFKDHNSKNNTEFIREKL